MALFCNLIHIPSTSRPSGIRSNLPRPPTAPSPHQILLLLNQFIHVLLVPISLFPKPKAGFIPWQPTFFSPAYQSSPDSPADILFCS